MGLRYADVEAYVKESLVDAGYDAAPGALTSGTSRTLPLIHPGPFTADRLRDKTPHAMLFLVLGNGAGLTVESTFDRPFITVRAIGMQNDFAYAETLAYDVDSILLGVANGVQMNGKRVLYVSRTGGSPQLVEWDSGERYHFQATYITEAAR